MKSEVYVLCHDAVERSMKEELIVIRKPYRFSHVVYNNVIHKSHLWNCYKIDSLEVADSNGKPCGSGLAAN